MTDFQKIFHAVDIAIKQQYCKTVRPQLSSDRFESFGFNKTRYEQIYNFKFAYLS